MYKKRKLIGLFLAMMAGFLVFMDTETVHAEQEKAEVLSAYYYMQQYKDEVRPEEEVCVDVTCFETNVERSAEVYQDREGSEKGIAIADETCMVTFTVDVPESGLYNMEMTYYPIADSSSAIIFGIKIDGELPYTEANNCVLSRVFQNEEIKQDKIGNDVRPQSIQAPEWRTQFICEQTGVSGNLSFYLNKGKHDITFCFDETPLLIEAITIKQEPYRLSYQDYISLYKQKGYTETAGHLEIYQAENYLQQSHSELWPGYDRSSSLTQPFEYDKKKINYGGGSQWSTPGQWISWNIDVPEDGLYNIGVKYRQTYLDGLFSFREVSIDGEIPFEELKSVRFAYSDSWENLLLGDEYNPYLIYLTAGEHILTMKNVIGDMESTMDVLQTVISNLNEIYLSVFMTDIRAYEIKTFLLDVSSET